MQSVQANRESEKLYSLITKLEDVFNRMLPTNTKSLKNSCERVRYREGTTIGKERTPLKLIVRQVRNRQRPSRSRWPGIAR